MLSIFDVASYLLAKEPQGAMSTVKLQKLCFYAYAWYAHQTGAQLYPEVIYAMRKGPVIGDLLTAHSGQKKVETSDLDLHYESWEMTPTEPAAYTRQILDAVWEKYAAEDTWDLVEISHKEVVWKEAWESRLEGSQRADLTADALVTYFLLHAPLGPQGVEMPERAVTIIEDPVVEAQPHRAFIEAIQSR